MGDMPQARTRKEEEKISYSLRLCVMLLDVSIATSICVLPGVLAPFLAALHKFIPLAIFVYYTWFDITGSVSWGKRCLGIHVLMTNGEPPGFFQRILRAGCRWAFPALALIAWRRVSLLDLFSGTRLTKTGLVPVDIKPKKLKRRFLGKKVPTPARRAVH